TGNTSFNGVQCPGPGAGVHSGSCSAFFGPVGSLGRIAQSVSTVAGVKYKVRLWFSSDGGTPTEFSVAFGGKILYDHVNLPAMPYTALVSAEAAAPATSPPR